MALLQKMIHTPEDIINIKDNIILTHVVDERLGREYTICGRAIPDSSLEYEGFERYGDDFRGSLKKCDCADCMRRINYIKHLR